MSRICLVSIPVLALALTAGCRTVARPLPQTAQAHLFGIEQEPGIVGDAIYEGSVFALDGRPSPLFRYERRVRPVAGGFESTHVTRDSAGRVVVVQSAAHDAAYAVTRADMLHGQTGISATAEVRGNHVAFTLNSNGRVSTSTETLDAPVVAGPTTFGFIVAHWGELERGASIPVRFAVLERSETIGFTLDRIPSPAGRTTIRMRPSNWLMRLAVPSTAFEFDSATRKIVEYTGRVPPMEVVNGGLKTLDARVTYEFRAPAFK